MKFTSTDKQFFLACACLTVLAGCASQGADNSVAWDANQGPVYAQSLEPTLPEAVSRAYSRSCRSCHGPDGHGIAAVAPDLRRAKPRSFEQWKEYLTNPQTGHLGAQMPPPTWINTDEIEVMANYLVGLLPPAAAPLVAEVKAPKEVKAVKKIVPPPAASKRRKR